MRRKLKKSLCILTTAAVISGGMQQPAFAQNMEVYQKNVVSEHELGESRTTKENGVVVSSRDEFMDALQQNKSPITVSGLITIGKDAEESGKMMPVKIPAGTVIQGTGESILNCRCPIQLEGDGVCFQNIELTFESTNALGSIPHREIFLAGYSLTFDNVKTWLEGGDNNFGSLGGTEKELLPTVYGGGYSNTEIGDHASLTVRNSNEKTMFQAIYMGHESGNDGNVPYDGEAELNLDAKLTVRENIDTSLNSQAVINLSGGKYDSAKAKSFFGNNNTTLTVNQCSIEQAVVENVGNLVIQDNACVFSKTDVLQNVTLKRGGCLDLNAVTNAFILGDFTGVENPDEERGSVVVNEQGSLSVQGSVKGTTVFQVKNRMFPGRYVPGKDYIIANKEKVSSSNFVLADKSVQNGYKLYYNNGLWHVDWADKEEVPLIREIEILSAPEKVSLDKIKSREDGAIPDETAYFETVWYDIDGNPYTSEAVKENAFYEVDYVIGMKTEYWQSDDPSVLDKTDWYNTVYFVTSQDYPGKYFLQAEEGGFTGDYTFLFCSEYFTGNLDTVGDVKALKDTILAEKQIIFYEGELEEQPPTGGDQKPPTGGDEQPPTGGDEQPPTGGEEQPPTGGDEQPIHIHKYKTILTKATLKKDGTRIKKCDCGKIKEKQTIYHPKALKLSDSSLVYTGKSRKPKVKVIDRKGKAVKSSAYKVTYQNNIKVGKATVTICFTGDYSGSLKKTFTIKPKTTSLSKLTAKCKGFTIKWKAQKTQTTGYELQYSTSGKFSKKTTKTVLVRNNKTASKVISKQKAKKKYYVRIRTYKTVKDNGKTVKIYSDWSKAKSITTKR